MLSPVDTPQTKGTNTMKKIIIGIAASAMALGASLGAVNAAGPYALPHDSTTGSMWDYIDAGNGLTEQLVLVAGLANTLDQCGNGKTLYTLFLPVEDVLAALLEEADMTVADFAQNPAAVRSLLNDHLVVGAVDPALLTSVPSGIKKLIAASGFVINIRDLNTVMYDADVWTDWYANGNQLLGAVATCNGWLYPMFGFFDTTNYSPTNGSNTGTTVAPTSEASELPDTL
jgi:hypothetical protein